MKGKTQRGAGGCRRGKKRKRREGRGGREARVMDATETRALQQTRRELGLLHRNLKDGWSDGGKLGKIQEEKRERDATE